MALEVYRPLRVKYMSLLPTANLSRIKMAPQTRNEAAAGQNNLNTSHTMALNGFQVLPAQIARHDLYALILLMRSTSEWLAYGHWAHHGCTMISKA